MRYLVKSYLLKGAVIGLSLTLCGCASKTLQNILNPFYESPAPEALKGELSDRALSGNAEGGERARAALENMASYRRAQQPQPYDPVVQPSVVRLMWIPDHLSRTGDLVPAHYYFLKVLNDRWAVTDAFDLEAQLKSKAGGSAVPYAVDKSDYSTQ